MPAMESYARPVSADDDSALADGVTVGRFYSERHDVAGGAYFSPKTLFLDLTSLIHPER